MSKKMRRLILYIVIIALLIGSGAVILNMIKPGKGDATPNETTSNNKTIENSTTNTSTTNNQVEVPGTVTLNTGVALKIGDTDVTVLNPTYYEGIITYIGTITDMYPETGRVLTKTRTGVVILNYRYVVDVEAQKETWQYDEPEKVEAINSPIRGVVYLDKDGKEAIHFLRFLDDTEHSRIYEIQEMKSYDPLTYVDVLFPTGEVPEDVQRVYDM